MTAPRTTDSSVAALYRRECARLGYSIDPAQQQVVAKLDELRARMMQSEAKTSTWKGLLPKRKRTLQRGLYIWGGVGRGKTWLMDLFFHSLPFKDKQRSHFHRFMQSVHDDLRKHRNEIDPLAPIAAKIAKRTRILCFDELFVADIADAMLLGALFRALFERGVTLVATSNQPPGDLYHGGLQRARFLPAIRLLEAHTEVLHLPAGPDYRLRLLERASIWFDSADPDHQRTMERLFADIAGEPGTLDATLAINHRRLHARRQANDVLWFSFAQLCDGPRGPADYIEIARCYHTVFLGDVPKLGAGLENQTRRFINLVDEFYDRAVKLVVSAEAPIDHLYSGDKLGFEFQRTVSRLIEMQSQQYLAREHQA